MEVLKFLEGLRNPVLDAFFSVITMFGEETLFIVIGLVFFWCVSKKQGYFLLFVGLFGTVINQFLKLWFRIPRPWVQDESFTIVESARAEATGYSFPSGHTQSSVGIFAGIARCRRETWLRIVSVVLCVLVPLSRMYLGVHTPLDVGVSIVLALVLVFGLYPIVIRGMDRPALMRGMIAVMTLLSVGFVFFVTFYHFPADIDVHNYESGLKNSYKMLGCFLGLWLTFEVDTRFTHFKVSAPLPAQILKVVVGFIPVLIIKTLLKEPLYAICGAEGAADGIRYFLIAAFAGVVWPMTFPFFEKLGKKRG